MGAGSGADWGRGSGGPLLWWLMEGSRKSVSRQRGRVAGLSLGNRKGQGLSQ